MALIYDASFDSQTRVLSLLDKAGNVLSSCEVPSKEVDDITKPLTFKATQDGSTVRLNKSGSTTSDFQTSRDGGNTWTDYTLQTDITLNTGDEVSFRAKTDRTSGQNAGNFFQFTMAGKIEAWHNVMSLYRTSDFATYDTVVDYAFSHLFMFCSSLTKAPALPATTLADSCYWDMFSSCVSLTEAPELPATALNIDCYFGMFRNCGSLTKAPELPATALSTRCYAHMFDGCRSLNEVHCKIPSSYTSDQVSSHADSWLNGVSPTGTFYTNADANWPLGTSGIPDGWRRVNEGAPSADDLTKPLTLKATQDGSTVKLTKLGSPTGSFQTSRDGGNTWADYTIDDVITLNTGDEVSFRAKADRSAPSPSYYFCFYMTGKIEAWHNVMSMLRTNDFSTYKSVIGYAFSHLFYGCRSLTKAPILPATTLNDSCYWSMFEYCESLTKAPALPATTLAVDCYWRMFAGCQSLTKAPVLPATTLAEHCYLGMFSGCRSLKEVRISAATTTATDALEGWLKDVSATGDFYCDPNATIFPTDSTSGIPLGWTRRNIADYPATP